MCAAAKDLSASLHDSHATIAWDELAQTADTPELLWRRAKRLSPTVLHELVPLLDGEPEAAFFLRPEKAKAKAKSKGTKAKGGSQNGTPAPAKAAKSRTKRAR